MDETLNDMENIPVGAYHPFVKHIQKGEGFPGQRIVVLPRTVVLRAEEQPLTRGLIPTDVGYFPHAAGHFRKRIVGIDQAIFIYCVNGSGWCDMAGERHLIRAGEVLVIPPQAIHAYGAYETNPWTIHWFHAVGELLPTLLNELDVSHAHPVIFLGEDSQVLALLEEVLDVLEHGYTPQQMLHASQALAHLLAVLIRHRHDSWRTQPDSRQKIASTIEFMKKQLDKPLQLDTLAALANLSRSRYTALFKEQTGFAPLNYFTRLRMHSACQWLDTTDLSIKTIALRLGYEDQLYFSRTFRAVNEMSPLEYRRKNKG